MIPVGTPVLLMISLKGRMEKYSPFGSEVPQWHT